ncbi:hypothetical protein PO909_002597 [Leuciscus waleckii]
MNIENSYPDATVLILGDFNHVKLKRSLPRFKQQIRVPTRYDKVLDQCYCTIANAFHAAPQGCVLSPLLYSLYTNDCTSHTDSVKMFKFADDTTVVGLIAGDDDVAYRKRGKSSQPLHINGEVVERVDSFRFLGTTISSSLKWDDNITNITKKAHQRLFFLRQLRKFGVGCKGMLQFYRAAIESVLTFSITVWYGNSTVQQRLQLDRIVNTASKIIGCKLSPICEIYEARIHRKGLKILQDDTHPANSLFSILPSGRRLRAIKTKTSRFLNSTYCRAIKSLNSS